MSETITEREAVQEPVVESAVEAVSGEQSITMLVDRETCGAAARILRWRAGEPRHSVVSRLF
ncbi:hypothetical protein ACFXPT_23820 [Streptomyces goshikiensis]|uniref:hypothetical protein n=1 Tax=Streptomyces goshikiensis TaxID=1942 RepID=UPI0036B6D25E